MKNDATIFKLTKLNIMKNFYLSVLFAIAILGCSKESITESKKSYSCPSVKTVSGTEITEASAKVTFSVNKANAPVILESGVCYSSVNPLPCIDDTITKEITNPGQISCLITGLKSQTLYFVRAYSRNCKGVGYGEPLQFTTK